MKTPPPRKPILSDHVRSGTRLVPKLVDSFHLETSSWIDDRLPELLWLGLLNDAHGWVRGAALAVRVATTAAEVTGRTRWWAPASSYGDLTATEWAEIRAALGTDLKDVLSALRPLADHYPNFPMRGMFEHPVDEMDTSGLKVLSRVIRDHLDSRGVPATQTLGNAVYVAFVTGLLTVSPGLALSRVPDLQAYPSTESSLEVAASVRATVTGILGAPESESAWPRDFWYRGMELDDCS